MSDDYRWPGDNKTQAERAMERHMSEWQKIDTAPKGTPILAVENYRREDYEGRPYPEDYQVVTKINGKWSSFGIYLESFEPTHWQPLPALPRS